MRREIFKSFKNGETRTIFVAKGIIDDHVGMPRAKVLIQFSSNGESPVQEVERLSHILQSNKVSDPYFYTLVLQHTDEVKFSADRLKFLGNQGYYFELNIHFEGKNEYQEFNYN